MGQDHPSARQRREVSVQHHAVDVDQPRIPLERQLQHAAPVRPGPVLPAGERGAGQPAAELVPLLTHDAPLGRDGEALDVGVPLEVGDAVRHRHLRRIAAMMEEERIDLVSLRQVLDHRVAPQRHPPVGRVGQGMA